MASQTESGLRAQVIEDLLRRVREDQFPSSTMLDMIESLLHDDEVDQYTSILLDKVIDETHPSMDLMRRLFSYV